MARKPKQKGGRIEGLDTHAAVALDTLAAVRGEMARLYRLALKGTLQPDEMTKFIYALKEIRACIEAELLDHVQERLAALSATVAGVRRG
ncbi:MAG: hypothetical protein QHD01_26265 [Bradyrhizobium sp.]|uniref:hypothetical protein n=1 Tax=Bradyrhizobium sp. TaxID=376 RepID=UPI0029B9349E|nr:hypothetical protein [Bradyrhizobium sp.]MDX3970084.1 hypothetical protein [Bradyrhizobium sp.]